MSKLISDLVSELHSLDEIEDDFELFIMSIEIDDSGEVSSYESVEPISHIEVDSDNQECLFHLVSNGKAMNIAKVIEEINSVNSDYALCSAEENTIDGPYDNKVDDSHVRIDNPIIGFGENIEQRRFFIVCQAFENNTVLH